MTTRTAPNNIPPIEHGHESGKHEFMRVEQQCPVEHDTVDAMEVDNVAGDERGDPADRGHGAELVTEIPGGQRTDSDVQMSASARDLDSQPITEAKRSPGRRKAVKHISNDGGGPESSKRQAAFDVQMKEAMMFMLSGKAMHDASMGGSEGDGGSCVGSLQAITFGSTDSDDKFTFVKR